MKQEIKERIEKIRKGEVPEGYRINKFGIYPEDWIDVLFNQIFDFEGGFTASRNDLGDEGIAYLHYGDIHKSNKNFIDVKKELSGIPKIDLNITKIPKKHLLKDGYVVFADASEDYEGIGKSVTIFNPDEIPFINGLHTIIAVPKNGTLNKNYSRFFLLEQSIRKQRMFYSQGISVLGISKVHLKKIVTHIPSDLEQKKISEILSTWDKAIELKEKLIEEKRESKKGFMQKLLFKVVASSIRWDEVPLKKCLISTSYPVNKPSEPYYALGIRSHCKGTLVRHVEDPTKIAMDTLYEVKENELIVNITFAWEGAITLLNKKDEGKLVSHRFPTYKFNEEYAIPDYFKHLVKTKWFVFQLGSLSPGGAGRNRVLNKSDLLMLKVLLPSVGIQIKIAQFLNNLDDEINLLDKELNQLKEQKRGLMQLLLTGIIRVGVN